MTDEGADEVKVFRRTDAEDLETNAQSSHQLAEDKKDVVLETELESRPSGDPLIAFMNRFGNMTVETVKERFISTNNICFSVLLNGFCLFRSKTGAFVKPIPSPSFANLANLQNAAAYSPSFGLPFMMPWIMGRSFIESYESSSLSLDFALTI
ncbi:hypothetical protein DICVIV_03273 [Dictyocaulus viviparus]|uniref:Uncharacterized protein n=1 Tax=Dictyocaulus viviparus TaxID=29172 RepID=A0A0D8Y3J8_DICVI|nr:hypothetical protein DICVIV_03273 [Dictyocaulus viviparus]